MTDKLIFPAIELRGRDLLFSDDQKTLIRAWFAAGKSPFAMVSFARPRRPRSTGPGSQSHRINGFIAQICYATGDDFERLKIELKQKAISRGWPFSTVNYRLPTGVLVELAIANSETTATVEQASVLIEVVEQDAAEKGVRLVEE